MFRPKELFIGLRYTRAKRRNHFISFISAISILGLFLGVTALITVISVMNGFEKELRERILGFVSHTTVSSYSGSLRDWRDVIDVAEAHPEVIGAAPYVERESMLKARAVSGALIRGVDPELEPRVSEIADQMVYGELTDLQSGEFGIVLGSDLAFVLGAQLGEKITVFAPQTRTTPAGVIPQVKRFTVVGIFRAGMHEYDRTLAITHVDDAARLFRLGEGVTGVRLKLEDMFRAYPVSLELQDELGGGYRTRDWTQQHANFFRAVKTEKTVMFVILSLIIAVAAFNIISTLVMVVTDKQADIAILRTLGTSPGSIMGIFMVQGMVIGVFGTLLGIVGGVLLATNIETLVPALERLLDHQFLSSDVYYISDLPSDMHWSDVIRIATLSFVLTIIATIYPAWRAARTDPAMALRYE